jgi:phage terminase large subunit-like protein
MLLDHSIFAGIADAIEYDWSAVCRAEQREPPGDDWTVWLFLGGRGAGKTRAGAETVRNWVETGKCRRVGLIAPTNADARDVMVLGESGIVNVCPPSNRPTFEPSKRRVLWPSGAVATLYSSEEGDRLRGPQHDGIWADEVCAWKTAQDVWNTAMLGVRLGKHPRAVVTTTPRPIPLLKALVKRDGRDVRITRATTYANIANLPRNFFSQITTQFDGTRLGRQELMAEILEDTPGALWTRAMIDKAREPVALPDMARVVVAVDPSGARNAGDESADSIGIIVAGKGVDGRVHTSSPIGRAGCRPAAGGGARPRPIENFPQTESSPRAILAAPWFGT